MNKIYFISIIALLNFSCSSSKNQYNEFVQDLEEISYDNKKVKFNKAYIYSDNCLEFWSHQIKTIPNCKEIAIEFEIYDKSMLDIWGIPNGIVVNNERVFLLNQDQFIGLNQGHLRANLSDTTNLIILDQISDTINHIDLKYNTNTFPITDYKVNKYPIPLSLDSLPLRKEKYYKSLTIKDHISGYVEKDIGDNYFLIRSYDRNGNNGTILNIDISQDEISIDSLHLDRFMAYMEEDSIWYGIAYEKSKTNKRNTVHLTGEVNEISDFTKELIQSRKIKNIIKFNQELYYFNETSVYNISGQLSTLDSSFLEFRNSHSEIEFTLDNNLKIIEYRKDKFGIRFGNKIIQKVGDSWETLYSIDSLGNRYSSSLATDNDGFYFTANGKAYYSDYKTTYRIVEQYNYIRSVHKGPKDFVIFNVGENPDEVVAVLYDTKTKLEFDILGYKLNNWIQNSKYSFVKYRPKTNSVLLLTNIGLYEISVDELLETRDNTR